MFQRYANPMIVLDRMIRAGRFTEFVQEVVRIRNKEMTDKSRWEYWLHKVIDMSYEDYLSLFDREREEALPAEVLTATVKESMGIINDFCPS